MTCGRAAAMLTLRIPSALASEEVPRKHGKAALSHANRGCPSRCRLARQVHRSILRWARTAYSGFNGSPSLQQIREAEGLFLSRETLRRILRQGRRGFPPQHHAAHSRRSGSYRLLRSPFVWSATIMWCSGEDIDVRVLYRPKASASLGTRSISTKHSMTRW